MIRYVVEQSIIFADREYDIVRRVLARHGVEVPERAKILPEGQLRIRFEKSDPRRHDVARELEKVGLGPSELYVPAFEPLELEQSELVRLRVEGFCGEEFETWAERLKLPPGTRVMDKRAMGKMDVARTYAWEGDRDLGTGSRDSGEGGTHRMAGGAGPASQSAERYLPGDVPTPRRCSLWDWPHSRAPQGAAQVPNYVLRGCSL